MKDNSWLKKHWPETFGISVIVGLVVFSCFVYQWSKTNENWCNWFGGASVPKHCEKHFHIKHCVEWSE